MAVGFVIIGPEWPSCFFHKKLLLFLIVYVDDFKLAGPGDNLAEGWRLLRQGLAIEKEVRIGEQGATFLGCEQYKRRIKLPNGGSATAMEYNMQPFCVSTCAKYETLVSELVTPTTTM